MQHLRDNKAQHNILGLVLNYGAFDQSYLPSCRILDPDQPLVLSYLDAAKFTQAYVPTGGTEDMKNPKISPLYASLTDLGSALFIVGTVDGLLDDSVLMAAKWTIAGNDAVLKFVPGAAHGFMTFDGNKVEVTKQGWDIMLRYIQSKL
jgi:acetyl esterase